jgi:hypothetical protein
VAPSADRLAQEDLVRVRLWLPILYVIVAAYLVFGPPSGAGHGSGGEGFFYISLPAGLISLLVQNLFNSGEMAVLSCFLGGVIQYAVIGYLIDRLITSPKSRASIKPGNKNRSA